MSTKRVKLTKKVVELTPCPEEGQVFLRDTEIKGFALRLTKGQKTFILEKFVNGRCMRMSIGPYGIFTVEQARQKAIELSGEIIKGNDPIQEKKSKQKEITFAELSEIFEDRHIKTKSENTCYLYRLILSKHLSSLHSRKLSSIADSDIVFLHKEIGKDSPYMANRTIEVTSIMFNCAKKWKLYKGDNPVVGLGKYKEEKRDRFIHPDELVTLNTALMQEPNPYTRAAFITMLFTGQRKTEVLTMKWYDIDFTLAIWHLPQTKSGRSHNVPLPINIVNLLQSLPRMLNNPYVFCGRDSGHLVNVTKAWKRIRERAGIQDVRIHDLRRTLGSWLAISGESLPMIGKVLNHSQPRTTAIYARLSLDPVRRALEENAQRMLAVTGGMDISGEKNNE